MDFTKKLLHWHNKKNTRTMPWKGETDPYKIWLSEIILQQTRVQQGLQYYEKFMNTFPDIHQLAKAQQKKIFKLWEGLGYYTRCKNLIETAKKIVRDYNGRFPSTYEEIRKLKGVGPYTAAAIASFAFNAPQAVVDGNVQRVLARYFGITAPIDTAAGKNLYAKLALALLDKKKPGIYNQAIMDFGAVMCKPKNPNCTDCVFQKDCMSYKKGWTDLLPLKARSIQKKIRWFRYLIIENADGRIYIRKRTGQDIWKNLYEFVLWESSKLISRKKIAASDFFKKIFHEQKFEISAISEICSQELTHQTIRGQFVHIRIAKPIQVLGDYILVKKSRLKDYPFPKFITAYLQNPLQQLF